MKLDQLESIARPKPPDQVLYRREAAPGRYEEFDEYYAQSYLSPGQTLPSPDLLEALHAYSSKFYQNATTNSGKHDFCSLDETALLALGCLLEETMAASLGTTGDLAFVEGEDVDLGASQRGIWNGHAWVRSVIERHPRGPRTLSTSKARTNLEDRPRSNSESSASASPHDALGAE